MEEGEKDKQCQVMDKMHKYLIGLVLLLGCSLRETIVYETEFLGAAA